jgi:hypothetical protein
MEANSIAKDIIPIWAKTLTALGERFAILAADHKSPRVTLALCLPCIDYAAAFLGIGILKARLSASSIVSQKDRLDSLLGQWVIFKGTRQTDVGILEFCPASNSFKIRLEKHGLWTVLEEQYWDRVRPTGREFNLNRRPGHKQVEKIEEQNRSISILSDLFEFNFWGGALEKSGSFFSIYGNKTRVNQELSEPLSRNFRASLGELLRPEGYLNYGETFHCTLETNRTPISDDGETALVLIEAGRSLPDQIAKSRNLNRVVLLARNAAVYQYCAEIMMQQSSLRTGACPALDIELPDSLEILSFHHR